MVIEGDRSGVETPPKNVKAKNWAEATSMNLSLLLRDWDALSISQKKYMLNEISENLASIAQLVEQAVDNR